MSVTNFTAGVGAVSIGDATILERTAAGLEKISASIDNVNKKSEAIKPPKWESFASSAKDFIQNPLQAAGNAAEGFLTKIGPMGAVVSVGAVAVGALGKAGFDAMKNLGAFGDEVEDTASRMGMTTKEVAQFRFAMKYAGGDMGQVEGIMRKLSQEIEGGGKNLREMGVQFRDVHTGALRPTSAILLEVAERLKALPEGATRNAAAIKVMGRAALDVLPDLMELPEGLQRAEELQKNYTPAQLARWKEYQHQVAEIESAWESLKRSMKDPLAGFVSVTVKGATGNNSDIASAMFEEFKKQLPSLTREDAERRLNLAGASGFISKEQYAKLEELIRKIGDSSLGAQQRAGILLPEGADKISIQPSGLKFAGLKMKDPYASPVDLSAYVSRIDAQIAPPDASARLEEAKKKLKELQDTLRSLHEQNISLAKQSEAADAVATQKATVAGIEAEIKATKELADIRKAAAKSDAEQYAAVAFYKNPNYSRDQQRRLKEIYGMDMPDAPGPKMPAGINIGDLFGFNYVDAVNKQKSDERQLAYIASSGAHSMRMAGLNAGPGGELAALREEMSIRVGMAKQVFAIDQDRWKLQQEMQAAGYEYEEKVAEMRRRGMEEYANFVTGGFQALVSGGRGGLRSFGESFLMGNATSMLSNAAKMTYKSGAFSLPGTGTAESPTWFGKLMGGTMFGPEVKLNTAGDKLITAGFQLTDAARALATSPSGGGGAFSAVSAAQRAAAMRWDGGGGGGGGSVNVAGMDIPMDDILFPTAPLSSGGMSWGRGAGIGAAGLGGAFGIYSGAKTGGLQGGLMAGGSGLAAAGSILSLALPKLASTLGPIGMLAGMGLGLLASSFDPKKRRAEEMEAEARTRAYTAPTGADYVTDMQGRSLDYSYRGTLRPIQVTVHNEISANDAGSFTEYLKANPDALSAGIHAAISGGNGDAIVGIIQQRMEG